jgi:myo-inositol 2-dehydrogenase/D-chiro-inositol 1-dehydrogenase
MALRVGLIGAGAMGRRHLDVLSRDERVTVVGVADSVDRAAREAADAVKARPCRDVGGLAALGAQAVFVTLPNAHHAAVALEALERGLHVFSEKPMATSLADARRIADQVRATGRVYQMGFNRRFAPAYRRLKQEILAGFTPYSANAKITDGDMLTPGWYTNVSLTGGVLYDCAVHMVDMVAWLIGPVTAVAALGRQSCYPDYDDIALLLRCGDNRPVGLTTCGHASWATPTERVEIYGDHALLVSEDMDRVRYATREAPEAPWQQLSAPYPLSLLGYADEDRAFVDACLGRAGPPVTVEDALRAVAVVDAAYASLQRAGEPVTVPSA